MRTKSKTNSKPVLKSQSKAMPSTRELDNATIQNNFATNILGYNQFLMPGKGIMDFGPEISQVESLWRNMRWYFISNERQPLAQAYCEFGLIQTICRVPVDDALRGGITIKTKQLNDEQIQFIQARIDRDRILAVVASANYWNRLHGGAGIITIDDTDYEEPFDIDNVHKDTPLVFKSADMWELFGNGEYLDGYDLEVQEMHFDYFDYYGKRLHHSRVMPLRGVEAPSLLRPRLRGWGLSVLEAYIRSFNQFIKAQDLTYNVLDEFKLDIYKIKDYATTLLSEDGFAVVQRRIQNANIQKNYQHALTMDTEDEYIQKQLSFAGLAETMQQIRIQLAADLRMPLTKLFGVSASGFNSGEDDIENYNAMIESDIRGKIKYDILTIVEILVKKYYDIKLDDLSIEFQPLRIMSAEQEENVKSQKFNRVHLAWSTGFMPYKLAVEACNKDNLLGVQVDPDEFDAGEEEEMRALQPGARGDPEGGSEEEPEELPKRPKGAGPASKLSSKQAKS